MYIGLDTFSTLYMYYDNLPSTALVGILKLFMLYLYIYIKHQDHSNKL